jgi:hypothetical protein
MPGLEVLLLSIAMLAGGAAFCFGGFRLFLLLLPIWGFITGFLIGASGVSLILGEGFLVSIVGWGVGLVVGVVFAVLSYLYWYGAVLVLGASIGYGVGAGFIAWLGLGEGIVAFFAGIGVGAVFVLAFIRFGMPRVLVIVVTSILGANLMVAGGVLLFGLATIGLLGTGPGWVIATAGVLASIVWFALALAGIATQSTFGAAPGTPVEVQDAYQDRKRSMPVRMS